MTAGPSKRVATTKGRFHQKKEKGEIELHTLSSVLACLILVSGIASCQETKCLQDQYGNQYTFSIDQESLYLYGSVKSNQGCVASTWPIIGSFVTTAEGTGLELTAANPLGEAGDPCILTFKIKGKMPNFQWYYVNPNLERQPGTWVACGTPTLNQASGKGMRK